jgi:hypothetical protein
VLLNQHDVQSRPRVDSLHQILRTGFEFVLFRTLFLLVLIHNMNALALVVEKHGPTYAVPTNILVKLVRQSMKGLLRLYGDWTCHIIELKGSKHGKVNKKNGMPFHCHKIFMYNKGSRLNYVQDVHGEVTSPYVL